MVATASRTALADICDLEKLEDFLSAHNASGCGRTSTIRVTRRAGSRPTVATFLPQLRPAR